MTHTRTESVPARRIAAGNTIIIDGGVLIVEYIGAHPYRDRWVEIVGPIMTEHGVDDEWLVGVPHGEPITRLAR